MTDIDGGGIINCSIKSVVVGCVVGIPSTFFSGRKTTDFDAAPWIQPLNFYSGLGLGVPGFPPARPEEGRLSHFSSPIFCLCGCQEKDCIIMLCSA